MRRLLKTTIAVVTLFPLAFITASSVIAQSLSSFGVLAGSTVTNTGPSVITGNVGVSPGSAVIGFPPGIVTAPGTIHAADAVAVQAQVELTTAYNDLAGRPTTIDLTGQDLGGLTLTPGVYNFASSAQLTGNLTLNALGNPNAVFIFNIGSTLTTGSSSTVTVIGGGQGSNVFWRVGSSATLGTTTSFVGDILALTSITLTTGANITCGSALARNGAVTLDTNHIVIRSLGACVAPLLPVPPLVVPPGFIPVIVPPGTAIPPGTTPVVLPPGVVPPGAVVILVPVGAVPPGTVPLGVIPVALPPNVVPVVVVIDAAFANAGGAVPQAFLDLSALSPEQLAAALPQLTGEVGSAIAPAGTQAMNSFLSLVLNSGFGDDLGGFGTGPGPRRGTGPGDTRPDADTVKVLGYMPKGTSSVGSAFASFGPASAGVAARPRLWEIWAAGYGGSNNTDGDSSIGSHDRSAHTFGFASGVDYLVMPDTKLGLALAGGGTDFSLSDGLGSGESDMLQAAIYGRTNFDPAYLAAALAYAFHDVSTDRTVTLAGNDRLTADFSAHNVAGQIEGGYRFGWVTPYAALRAQAFHTPSYSESAASGFALGYDARTTTTIRSELGARIGHNFALGDDTDLTLRTRVSWAHDNWSNPSIDVAFLSLAGSDFSVEGAKPASDSLLVSAGAQVRFSTGFALAGLFDSEFADGSQTYVGSGRLSYRW